MRKANEMSAKFDPVVLLVGCLLMLEGFISGSTLAADSLAAPKQAAVIAEHPFKASPKYILCGAADLQHNAWFGSEEQGVYEYGDGKWKQFTTAEGLGGNDVTALACDCLGRIWAGHVAHGLSIYNGKEWKNYTRATGPAGARIFAIATCPVDGDVWMATEEGLTRYSLKKDVWSYYDKSTGMPAIQATSMAFDSRGDLYVGLQIDGIAVARVKDNYTTWTHITGPTATPTHVKGGGLPSNLVNTVAVSRNDVIYAGTCRGLACSADRGVTWMFCQGRGWAVLVRGRVGGIPDHFDAGGTSSLAEDWITQLKFDAMGVLWIGYQTGGYQTYLPGSDVPDRAIGKMGITAIVPVNDGHCVLGSYGKGASEAGVQYSGSEAPAVPTPPSALAADAFPSTAAPLDAPACDAMRSQLEALAPATGDSVELLSDDWETGGDWVGRYGTRSYYFFGHESSHPDRAYKVGLTMGPYDTSINWFLWDDKPAVETVRQLFDPGTKKRLYCETNDGTWQGQYNKLKAGPDIFVHFTLPAGTHVVSLFFQNRDAHSGTSVPRDYSCR